MKWFVAAAWAWAATGMAAVPVSFDANGGHFAFERWNEVSESFSYETPTVMTNVGEWAWEEFDADVNKVFYWGLSYRYGGDFQRPVRQGYAFDGWYTKRTGGEFAEMNESDSRTVYAHWIKTNAVSLAASVGETNLTFITGGDAPWFGQTNDVYYATAAARSGPVGDNETSWLETTVTGPGLVEFTWGVSCEETEAWGSQTHYRDCVTFSVDGVVSARLAGWGDPNHEYSVWKEEGCWWFIEQGKHTLRWEYRKDGSSSAGKDCAWLEGVCWEQIPPFNKILDNEDLSFTSGGDYAENVIGGEDLATWFDEFGRETHDGVDAATTGIHQYIDWDHWLNLGYTNWMETTVTGPGTVSFWWKAICVEEELYDDDGDVIGHLYPDSLDFLIDGSLKSRVDGKTCDVWRHESFPVPDGSHTLRWAERSDLWYEGTASWVDQVVWRPNQQTLTFDANGGRCELETLTAAYDGVYMLLPTPAWSNHIFLGWYTARAGGSRVENGQLVTPAAFRTLYAQWTAKQATTFVVNGATAASTVRTNTMGGTYGAFPAVTRTGCKLLGWFTAAEGGTRVAEGSIVTPTETRTLYAHWEENRQTVLFDANGGVCMPATASVPIGEPYGTLPVPVKEEHAFQGWFTAASGGSQVKATDTVTSDETRTLYAHWTTQQVTTFKGNGGSPTTQKTTNTVGRAYETLPTAKWSGHIFLGWFTKASGGTQVTQADLVTETATRTLYAHWTDKQVTTFNGNGGKPASQATTNTIYADYGTFPVAKWSGHALVGWFNAPEGGKRVYTNSTVTLAATRTLYAQWTTEQVTTFKGNGGTPEIQKTTNAIYADYGAFPEATWPDHVFLGWFNHPTSGKRVYTNSTVTLAATRTLYAHWTDKQTVTFKGNGGSPESQAAAYAMQEPYGPLPTPKWSGHVFLGWFTKASGGTEVTAADQVAMTPARTLYAHWTDKQKTTFLGNGGKPATYVTTNTIYADYGTFPEAKWSGHALVGWFNAPEGGKRVYTNSTVTLAATRTLYAQWTTNQVTTFKGNGGTPEIQKTTNAIYAKYGTFPEAEWEGHKFLGWFNHPTSGKRVYTNSTVTLAATRTLYAHWSTAKSLAITGMSVSDPVAVPAARAVHAGASVTVRFEAEAGSTYGIQWTDSLSGEWETLLEYTAEADGEAEVEAPVSGRGTGFFRITAR